MNDLNGRALAIVITPSIGSPELKEAVASVENQNFEDVIHFIVVDGEKYAANVSKILQQFDSTKHKQIVLPSNTAYGIGGARFNGHRIYAAFSYLVNSQYVFFLDEDNWYDANHVGSLIGMIEEECLDWAYSLRKIYTHDGKYVANDDCENLGRWPPFSGRHNLVDTSCYAFKREVLAAVGHKWFHPLGADRAFFRFISSCFPNFKTSSRYSVNYRLHDNRPPAPGFFLSGNKYMRARYGDRLPWSSR